MKIYNKIISILLVLIMCVPFGTVVNAYDGCYNNELSSLKYATPAENQGDKSECLAYALLSTAGSYCIKNNVLTAEKANFSEKKLINNIGDSVNFGEVVYSAAKYNLGSGCYITGIEDLTDRGELYIKHKIKENGSVMAAIGLPSSGMTDSSYYSAENASFNYNNTEQAGNSYHAFSIVGWDDDFSKDKFLIKPEKNGAWICKNSYGTDYGKGGYFYLPYSYKFVYSAAVEVSKLSGTIDIRESTSSVLWLGYVAAVGFRSYENIEKAQIFIKTDKDETKYTCDIVDGYNCICLDAPAKAKELQLYINDVEISASSVNCIMTWSKNDKVTLSEPDYETDWIETVDTIDNFLIRPTGSNPGTAIARTRKQDGSYINHSTFHNFIDNCWYITPCDGYRFTADTVIKSLSITKHSVYSGETEIISDKTIRELVDESDDICFENGCLIIYSYDIGSGYIDGIDIHTDENGKVESIDYYSNGQIINFKGNFSLYSDNNNPVTIENPGKEINDVSGLEYYYTVIDMGTYLLGDDLSVKLNGKKIDTGVEFSDTGNKVLVKINIPPVRETLLASIFSVFSIFTGFFVKIFSW